MLIACWSAKGGSGTTVVAASLALLLARRDRVTTLADLAGDAAAALGVAEPTGPGIADWANAGHDVPAAALGDLASAAAPNLRLLPRGDGTVGEEDAERVAVALATLAPAVVDCGVISATDGASATIASAATHSLLVLRPCFLSLRRALAAPLRPSGVVLVHDQPRALGRGDIEDVLGVPVRAEVRWDAAVARAVDAGLLARSIPTTLTRALREAA